MGAGENVLGVDGGGSHTLEEGYCIVHLKTVKMIALNTPSQ